MKQWPLLLLLTGTLAMAVFMTINGAPLKTPQTPHGIIDLEFAYNTEKVNIIATAWQLQSADGLDDVAENNTMWDFVFILFYASFFFAACKTLSKKFITTHWKHTAGIFLSKTAIAAGVLDIGENLGMLQTLSARGNDSIYLFTALCASVKWLLVLLILIYLLFALISQRQRMGTS
ncbi:hypothetical protein [Ferruginibacter sp.]